MLKLIQNIYQKKGIRLVPYSEGREAIQALKWDDLFQYKGFCFQLDGDYYTFYDDAAPADGHSFTLAHELGHILMGHIAPGAKPDSERDEQMANIFGAVLLALAVYDEYGKERLTC